MIAEQLIQRRRLGPEDIALARHGPATEPTWNRTPVVGLAIAATLAVAAVLLMGCGQQTQNPPGEEKKSGVQNVVDTMSQRNALEAGRKAGRQIRHIRAEQDKNLQETESQ